MLAASCNVDHHSARLGSLCWQCHPDKHVFVNAVRLGVRRAGANQGRGRLARFVVPSSPLKSAVKASTKSSPAAENSSDSENELPANSADERCATAKEAPAIKTSGIRGTPQAGGIKNATLRYELPPPAVAVRNLVEQAQIAHLCTIMSNMHHRRAGYPFGTVVDFASDGAGFPVFALSGLAIHMRNLVEDPRCCLVVQMPGWTGLANARVTIFGDVYQLPPEMQRIAQEVFVARQTMNGREEWAQANTVFFRMHHITDIYFVGGFGTMTWVSVDEYTSAIPDRIATVDSRKTLQVLHDRFGPQLQKFLKREGGLAVEEVTLISIDQLGLDIRVRHAHDYSIQRLPFHQPVQTLEDAVSQIQRLVA